MSMAALPSLSKEGNCDKLRKDAVEILKEDLHTLGSSTNRTYMPDHFEDLQERRC